MSINRALPLLGLGSLVLLLQGCIPAPMGTYYKPYIESKAASYSGDACYGQAGAPANIAFELAPGILLSLSTMKYSGVKERQELPVRIKIELPPNRRFKFLAPQVEYATSLNGPRTKLSMVMDVSGAQQVDATRPIDPVQIAPASLNNPPGLDLQFQAYVAMNSSIQDGFVPKHLRMEFPAIALLGKDKVVLPPLVLKAQAEALPRYKDQNSLVYPTKEGKEKDEQYYQACLTKSSESHCKSLRYFNGAAYQYTQGPFAYSGRWYVFDVEKNSGFKWDLKLEYKNPVAWRFVNNQIQFIDEDTKKAHIYQIDKLRFAYSFNAPVNAPIFMEIPPSSKGEPIRLSISGDLGGEGLNNYFIFLPPIEIDGKAITIEPIRLEKRSLDFGIMPFNC